MAHAYDLARPLLLALPPERAHRLTLAALRTGWVRGDSGPDDPVLSTRVWDLAFANPVGLAAGFDKNAEAPGPLLRLGLGFGIPAGAGGRTEQHGPEPRMQGQAGHRATALGQQAAGIERPEPGQQRQRLIPGGPRRGIDPSEVGRLLDAP